MTCNAPSLVSPLAPPLTQPLHDVYCRIVRHTQVGTSLWEMVLVPEISTLGQPVTCLGSVAGQFVMVGLPEAEGFSFRRPMSVYWECTDTGEFAIFYKVHGRGTRRMAAMAVGETVSILGPLGNVWPSSVTPADTLLIGGGIGVAPLLHWQRRTPKGEQATLVYGVRAVDDVGIDLTKQSAQVCTDDGSAGFAGNVVAGLQANPAWYHGKITAFVCGPLRMMAACVDFLAANAPDMQVYVSLEERMPCGTGACTGCVVPVVESALPVKTCQTGPIYPAQTLDWPAILGACP